jgi:thioredoxin-related protein
MRDWLAVLCLAVFLASGAGAQERAPQPVDIPRWFSESFLDIGEDVREAARDGRRLMLYFGQDGCPYCRKLMLTNFSQRDIVAKTRRHFVAVALDIWGAREVTWLDGRVLPEKEFARLLDVQFTPTLLFFDEQGAVVARLNGYYPPHLFEAVLDYAAGKAGQGETLAAFLKRGAKTPARAKLHDEPFFVKPPYDLARKPGSKPAAVLFETTACAPCDELHREGFKRGEVRSLVARFDVARFALGAPTALTTPDGTTTTADAWASALGVMYTPTLIFFDDRGAEVFRVEAYLRPFHLASSLDYVASGAYRSEPSFQRFIQGRAERLRARGAMVDLWR